MNVRYIKSPFQISSHNAIVTFHTFFDCKVLLILVKLDTEYRFEIRLKPNREISGELRVSAECLILISEFITTHNFKFK